MEKILACDLLAQSVGPHHPGAFGGPPNAARGPRALPGFAKLREAFGLDDIDFVGGFANYANLRAWNRLYQLHPRARTEHAHGCRKPVGRRAIAREHDDARSLEAAVDVALIVFVCTTKERKKIWLIAVPALLGFASYLEMACRVLFGVRLL